jgi:hypothetical protein
MTLQKHGSIKGDSTTLVLHIQLYTKNLRYCQKKFAFRLFRKKRNGTPKPVLIEQVLSSKMRMV